MGRLTDAEFEAACDEEFPVALEAEARRARTSEAALLEALQTAVASGEHEGACRAIGGRGCVCWVSAALAACAKAEGK